MSIESIDRKYDLETIYLASLIQAARAYDNRAYDDPKKEFIIDTENFQQLIDQVNDICKNRNEYSTIYDDPLTDIACTDKESTIDQLNDDDWWFIELLHGTMIHDNKQKIEAEIQESAQRLKSYKQEHKFKGLFRRSIAKEPKTSLPDISGDTAANDRAVKEDEAYIANFWSGDPTTLDWYKSQRCKNGWNAIPQLFDKCIPNTAKTAYSYCVLDSSAIRDTKNLIQKNKMQRECFNTELVEALDPHIKLIKYFIRDFEIDKNPNQYELKGFMDFQQYCDNACNIYTPLTNRYCNTETKQLGEIHEAFSQACINRKCNLPEQYLKQQLENRFKQISIEVSKKRK